MKKKEAQELLRKYCQDKCNKRELEIIERWYHSFDKNEDESMDFSDTDNLIALREEMLGNVIGKINQAEYNLRIMQDQAKSVTKINHFIYFQNFKRVAAVLFVAAGLGVFFYGQNNKILKKEEARAKEAVPKEIPSEKMLPSTIYLSDGSVVWLKGHSTLEYPKIFSGDAREVTLTGEAFFDVAKDRTKPFIIHSTNFTTRVIGTSFNIKAYENDESQEVVVVTGKVVVSVKESSDDKVKELILKPNQKAIYSKKHNSLIETQAEERSIYNSSTERKLAFDETSLENIIKVLNATYAVNISVSKESMKDCIITADLTNETLKISIEILSQAINAEYATHGKDIILSGKGCVDQP